jgi:hypothetical protein
MDGDTKRKLDMARRVLFFSRAHPSANPGLEVAVDRFERSLKRANQYLVDERDGRLIVTATVAARDDLRRQMHIDLLLLSGVARSAHAEEPMGVPLIPLPSSRGSLLEFQTSANVAINLGRTHLQRLQVYGLHAEVLDRLTELLARIVGLQSERNNGGHGHIGAHAGLNGAVAELMRLAQQLDRLNRHRFRHDPEILAVWCSSRKVSWRGRKTDGPTDEATVA